MVKACLSTKVFSIIAPMYFEDSDQIATENCRHSCPPGHCRYLKPLFQPTLHKTVPFDGVFKTNVRSCSWFVPFTHGADEALKIQWFSFSEVSHSLGRTNKLATQKSIFKNCERGNRNSICFREIISENRNNFLVLYFSDVFLVILIAQKQTQILLQSIYFWNIIFSSLSLDLLINLKCSQYFLLLLLLKFEGVFIRRVKTDRDLPNENGSYYCLVYILLTIKKTKNKQQVKASLFCKRNS